VTGKGEFKESKNELYNKLRRYLCKPTSACIEGST